MTISRQQLTVAAARSGGQLLADNAQWTNRVQIRSETSDNLYVIAQRKSDGSWGCGCRGWVRHRHCKHLDRFLPAIGVTPSPRKVR